MEYSVIAYAYEKSQESYKILLIFAIDLVDKYCIQLFGDCLIEVTNK